MPGTRLETTNIRWKESSEMRREESKQRKGRKDRSEHGNTWGGNFQGKYSMSVFPGGRGCAVLREQVTQRTKRYAKHGWSQMSKQGSDHYLFSWVPDRALYPTSLLLLCLNLFTCVSDWDVPVLLPSTACRWGKCWMCEGELVTVSRAVRFPYDVLKGSVRARRGKVTMGGCLKPLEDRKRPTSETLDKFNLLKPLLRLCQTAKLTILAPTLT